MINSANDIKRYLEKMGVRKITDSFSNINCTCPFGFNHKNGRDVHPSFSVNKNNPYLCICGGCGIKGSFEHIIKKYERETGVVLDRENRNENNGYSLASSHRIRADVKDDLFVENVLDFNQYKHFCKTVPQYVFNRGLTKEQCKKWRLGFNQKTNRLFIPIFNRNKMMVGYSERALNDERPKYKHSQGFRRNNYLYGEEFITDSPVAFLSEGFFDVFALDRIGVPNAFATMGTVPSEKQIKTLARFNYVIIFPHNDDEQQDGNKPGIQMASAFKAKLEARGVNVIVAPIIDGYKDIGDWPKEELKRVVTNILESLRRR